VLQLSGIFILAGCAAGFLAGLLGIGGGFVVVPVLVWVLPLAGVPPQLIAHMAVGTSLMCICVTALSSSRAHHRRGGVDWQTFAWLVPGLVTGTYGGSQLAARLSGPALLAVFVVGCFSTAIYLISGHRPTAREAGTAWPLLVYGGFTGTVSALIGIGGGSLLVPFLVYRGEPMVRAVGTAAACGLPIALVGATGYAYSGWQVTASLDYTSGFLYWPAFFGIVIFSSLSAPLGAKVAHQISESRLRQAFAGFLFFSGGQILYSHWS